MPPTLGVPTLESFSALRIASDLLDCLDRLDTEQCQLFFQQADANVEEFKRLNERINRDMLAIKTFLEEVPGLILNPIYTAVIDDYVKRFMSAGNRENQFKILSIGSGASQIMEPHLQEVSGLFSSPVINVRTPKLVSLLSILFQGRTKRLDLTPLSQLDANSDQIVQQYKDFVTESIPKVPYLTELNVAALNSRSQIPQIENSHLQLLGRHCPLLEKLNVSYQRTITGEGICHLGPGSNPEDHPGCVNLKELLIFDTGVYVKDVAAVISKLPNLHYLGYKETGKVIKLLFRDLFQAKLKITHVDNRGSKSRKLVVNALRCKKKITNAISALCPDVKNIKLRISDDDVFTLNCLDKLESVELVYHVSNIQSPGSGTKSFLEVRGQQLTALTIICNNMTMSMISVIGENCVNLRQLWFRSNHFLNGSQMDSLAYNHNCFTKLEILYLRVGLNSLYMTSNFPSHVIPLIVKNAPLKELILAIRSNIIDDEYIIGLIKDNNLTDLEKILIMVPGMNSIPGILNITESTLDYIVNNCKNIRKIGNLLTWKIERLFVDELMGHIKDFNWDLTVINKKMNLN